MLAISRAWNRFWFQPISTSSISVFRIFFGILSGLSASFYLEDCQIWFGLDGPLPPETVSRHSPALLGDLILSLHWGSEVYLALLWIKILACLAVTLGMYTRTSLFILWLADILLYLRNPLFWHHGDTLLRVYGTVLLFCPAGEMYSVDSWRRRRDNPEQKPRYFAPWGQRLIQAKLSIVYVEAFFGKIVAPRWLDGSAVYYATHFPDGNRHPIPAWMDHLWVYHALTGSTLLIEFSLMALIWFRPLRYVVLAMGVLFHLGIHWFLHLDLLEFAAMLGFIAFIYPEDMESFVNGISQRFKTQGAASSKEKAEP